MQTINVTTSTHKQIRTYAKDEDVNFRLGQIIGEKFVAYRSNWDAAGKFQLETSFPLFLVLELINKCNYRCPSCVHGYDDLRRLYQMGKAQEMPSQLYEKIILEAEKFGCPSICMNNIGEPTLVKDLTSKMEFARDHGFIDIMFNTNGLLHDRILDSRFFESGITRLMISLDAATPETYKKVRVGGNWDKVIRNLDTFLELRQKGGYKLPLLRTTIVRSSLNEKEIDDFVAFWSSRIDYVSIQEFISPRPGDARFDTMFAQSRVFQENPQCPQPWQYLSIKPNGDVAPCCAMFSDLIKVGNAFETSLQKIWSSNTMRDLRLIHKEGRYQDHPTCKICLNNSVSRQ